MGETMDIDEMVTVVLAAMAAYLAPDAPESQRGHYEFDGEELSKLTGASPRLLNDAVDLLEQRGLAEVGHYLGTHPFSFGAIFLTARGRAAAQRVRRSASTKGDVRPDDQVDVMRRRILEQLYRAHQQSPAASCVWEDDRTTDQFRALYREAEWLADHGLISAQLGVDTFTGRITTEGREYWESLTDGGAGGIGAQAGNIQPGLVTVSNSSHVTVVVGQGNVAAHHSSSAGDTINTMNVTLAQQTEAVLNDILEHVRSNNDLAVNLVSRLTELDQELAMHMASTEKGRQEIVMMLEDLWHAKVAQDLKPRLQKLLESQGPPVLRKLLLSAALK